VKLNLRRHLAIVLVTANQARRYSSGEWDCRRVRPQMLNSTAMHVFATHLFEVWLLPGWGWQWVLERLQAQKWTKATQRKSSHCASSLCTALHTLL